jgi:hypothetical protein
MFFEYPRNYAHLWHYPSFGGEDVMTLKDLQNENRILKSRIQELESKLRLDQSDDPDTDEELSQTSREGNFGFSGAVQSSEKQARRALKSKAKKHLRDNPHLLHAFSAVRELISRVPNLDARSARALVREAAKRR